MSDKKRHNLIKGMVEKKNTDNQPDQPQTLQMDTLPDFKKMKSASEMVGAFKGFSIQADFSRIIQGRLIEEMKAGKRYQDLGYNNFDDFCKNELKISPATAYNIMKERNTLGIVASEALQRIGLKPKDLKILTQLKADDEIETSENKIKIDDNLEIEINSDNVPLIREVIDKIKKEKAKQKKELEKLSKSHDENSKKIQELEERLNAPIPVEIGEFEKSLEPFKVQFDTLYGNLDRLKKQVENDPEKLSRLKGLIAYFYQIVTTKGSSILGEEI